MSNIKKVIVRECPECDDLILVEDVVRVNCFKLSDFKEISQGNEELILSEDVFRFKKSETVEVNKCPDCDGLFEEFFEKEKKMWDNGYKEYFDTKKEAEEDIS